MEKSITQLLDEVKERIRQKDDSSYFAVFDFDNTFVVNDIQEAMLAYMCRKFLLRNRTLADDSFAENNHEEYHRAVFLHYHKLLEENDVMSAYEYAIRALAGFREGELIELTKKVILEEGKEAKEDSLFGVPILRGLPLREKVVALARDLSSQGVRVWIITASSETVVRAALEYHNLEARCIGMKLKEENGIFTDELLEPLSVLEGKVACIKKFIHKEMKPLVGVGDSMNDLPMLEYAEMKVVVDRGNKLAEEARRRGWYML